MVYPIKRRRNNSGEIQTQTIMIAVLGLVILSGLGMIVWQLWFKSSDKKFEPVEQRYSCQNKRCADFNKEFEPPEDDRDEEEMQAELAESGGGIVMLCPTCNKRTAVVMTQCPACEKYWVDPGTLEIASDYAKGLPPGRNEGEPICPHCGANYREERKKQLDN